MKIYQIKTKQKLPITVKQAWDFLSDPKNLSEITPDYMNFKILSGALGIFVIFIFTQIGAIPFIVAIFNKVGVEGRFYL